MTWNGEERREHQRFGVKRLGIQYSKAGLFAFLAGVSEKYLVLNISESGLFFMTKEDLREGQRLNVRINLPDVDMIRASCTVVWNSKSSDHDAWRVGAEFHGLSASSRRRLKNLIDTAVLDRIDVSTSIYLREVERL